ncbi:MAG TPA: 4-alpha-glucanotransferase [Vicinamibacterales bacterium]|nr:4-alpha-glucanotransferase [Vicinamibacterales bacterium]
MADTVHGRRAGALVPLFSIPSSRSWGIGEIADLPIFAEWAQAAGLSVVQLLPVNEMADGQSSPYSALSAMAIDPIFIALRDVPEFAAAGGEGALTAEQRKRLDTVRRSRSVRHREVRELKTEVLEGLFARFLEEQWRPGSPRALAMRGYMERERWWLDDYAVFRALHAESGAQYWLNWEPPLRDRDPRALNQARSRLEREVLYYTWLQWVAGDQWAAARQAARGVAIFGDFPFMVSGDSADVWVRQREFRLDAAVGVPPDAFSETGQDWGLPVYRWHVHAANGYEWLRQRARRCAELFDGFRVDHLVGFYRTFVREQDDSTYFVPDDQDAQREQGERLLSIFRESGAAIIAEDLGVVPDFVRASLERLGVPGLKVMRWEREWDTDGQPFRHPASYPARSVAISGTHDTESLAEWWDNADAEERASAAALPHLRAAGISGEEPFSNRVRDALLESIFAAGSDLLLVPVQDAFGWRDRINIPAVVNDENWSWRLRWPADRLPAEPQAAERATFLRRLARQNRRSDP